MIIDFKTGLRTDAPTLTFNEDVRLPAEGRTARLYVEPFESPTDLVLIEGSVPLWLARRFAAMLEDGVAS